VESEALIAELARRLKPVRVLPSPARQAAAWFGLAAATVTAVTLLDGVRPDLAARLAVPSELAQWLASIATALAGALAAAMLARPDRPVAWALLPLAPLVAWLAALGFGAAADVARLGPAAMEVGENWGCVVFTAGLGLVLTLGLLVMLRHAGPVRPVPVLIFGGLASAALTSAGCSVAHRIDAALPVLVWHGAAVLLAVGLAWAFGGRLLVRPPGG
jgi:hypothetical protein